MANQIVIALPRVTDANGDAVSGAKAYFYQKGTTTPVTVYSDEALSVPHASPLVADSGGVFAQVFHGGATEVKAVVQDADDAALYTLDPAPLSTGTASAAENVTVAPFTGVTGTNVQAALEDIQENITAVGANIQTLVQTGGSANAYTLNAAETITAYAAGQRFLIRLNHTNTGAATLNVDGLGAKNIKKYNGSGSLIDPGIGELVTSRVMEVTYDGTQFVVISPDPLALQTKQTTTSGTQFDFTIPSGVKEITVMFNEVSLSGTDNMFVQIGDSGGIETTNYSSVSDRGASTSNTTSAFVISRAAAGTTSSGMMQLRLMDAATFTWVSTHSVGSSGGSFATGAGMKALSAELTTVRITRAGSDTFDAGEVNVSYR